MLLIGSADGSGGGDDGDWGCGAGGVDVGCDAGIRSALSASLSLSVPFSTVFSSLEATADAVIPTVRSERLGLTLIYTCDVAEHTLV